MKKFTFLILLFVFAFIHLVQAQTKKMSEDQKYVVIEELTGTWCSYCPRGIIKGRQLSHDHDHVIFVAIHSNDPMAYPEHSTASGLSAAPSANVNRKHMGTDTQSWESLIIQETGIDPPAYITVETNYNESNRELEAIITAEFINDFNGNLRLGALIMEDAVTGQGGYEQSNSYSGGSSGPMGGFEDLPNPVPSNMIAYDHLSRYLLGGYDGVEGSIPGSVNAGETHSYTFTYTLPEAYNHEYIRVAGWLINNNNGHILNAGKSSFLPGYDNAKPHFISEPITTGNVGIQYNYQFYTADPETDELVITATDLPDWLSLVETAQHSVHTAGLLSGVPTETGTFPITLSVSDGDWTSTQSFDLIIAENPGAGWELIGEEGFSNFTTSTNIIKLDTENTPYVAVKNYSNPIEVYKYDNENWSTVGGNIGTADSDMGFDLDSEGNPWIAFNDVSAGSKCIVKMYDGNNWISIGDPVSTGGARSIDLALDNNNTPYVAFYEQDMNAAGFIYKFESGSWQMVGDGQIDPGTALFFELDFFSDNTPVLLWCKAPSNYNFYSRVSIFENGSWNLVGGGNITENTTYFYHHIAIDENDHINVSICETVSTEYHIYQENNDNWIDISPSETINGEYHDLIVDTEGTLYFGFQNAGQGSQTSVLQYDGNAWSPLGPIVISGVASNHSMAINSNNEPYISYTDDSNGEKTTIKAYLSSDAAIANINPSSIEFPDTEIDQSAEESITISNSGTITLEVNNISSNNYVFAADLTNFTLEPGESQELIISFEPSAEQLYEGILSMETNDPYQTLININLSGQGRLVDAIAEIYSEFQIIPNPATNHIKIVAADKITRISIFNINGQLMMNNSIEGYEFDIDLEHYEKGIYLIKTTNSENSSIQKLMIQ